MFARLLAILLGEVRELTWHNEVTKTMQTKKVDIHSAGQFERRGNDGNKLAKDPQNRLLLRVE